eukprot:457765-Prymnesium_polylepis.2
MLQNALQVLQVRIGSALGIGCPTSSKCTPVRTNSTCRPSACIAHTKDISTHALQIALLGRCKD